MASKIKLYSLDCEDVDAEFVGRIDAAAEKTYVALRLRLHEFGVLDWSVSFWDVEGKCRIRGKLEGMTTIDPQVFVIPSTDIDNGPCKRHCGPHVSTKIDSVSPLSEPSVDVPEFPDFPSPDDVHVMGNRETIDTTGELLLQSTLINNDVRQAYLKAEEKLRDHLRAICLADHEWCVKSWDHNGVGVVKVFYTECSKFFGGSNGDHSGPAINNLFNNFRKSHTMSNAHVRAWCRRKGVDFYDHPQSAACRGKTVEMTLEDYKRKVRKGYEILADVNSSATSKKQPFVVLGNTEDHSFFYKIRCIYCNDKLSLCPLKNNLVTNLQNHLRGEKHETTVECTDDPKQKGPPVCTGRRGRPSLSSSNPGPSQSDLHSWLSNNTSGSAPGDLSYGHSDGVCDLSHNACLPFCVGIIRNLPVHILVFLILYMNC
jgi:hypothetical protein